MTIYEQNGLKFNKKHIINPQDYTPKGKYNPHNIQPYLIYNECGTICVVFASHLQEALDIAVDEGRFECQRIVECSSEEEDWYVRLGNECEFFDLSQVNCEILNIPFKSCS